MTHATADAKTAVTLGAFRACEHGLGIRYELAMDGKISATGVDVAVRAAKRAGALHDAYGPTHAACYAVLDLLDARGDIVADYCIPTREAWEWWQRGAILRPAAADCRTCEPVGWAAVYGPGGTVDRYRRRF